MNVFFGLDNTRETPRNQAEYVSKLQSWLMFANRKAAEEASKHAGLIRFVMTGLFERTRLKKATVSLSKR